MEWVSAPIASAAGWILTLTFGWAALAKFIRGDEWPPAVTRFGFRGGVAQTIVFAVPIAEITIVILFVVGAARAGAALTVALVAAFSAAITRARMVSGRRVPCGCFGKSRERDYRLLLARNAALALAAATVLLGPRDVSLAPPEGTEWMPVVLSLVGAGVVAWAAVQTTSALRRR